MEDSLKNTEQEFLGWLSRKLASSTREDVKTLYFTINAMLLQKKILSQSIVATTQESIEVAMHQVNKVFSSKKLRSRTQKLLIAYMAFLSEKETLSRTDDQELEECRLDKWIRFDFSNSQEFERTVPTQCIIAGQEIKEKNWARILVAITEQEIVKSNPALESLYREPLITHKKDRPYFLKNRIEGLHCIKLSNGYWINANYSIPRLMDYIYALCLHCGYSEAQIQIYGIHKGNISPQQDNIKGARSAITSIAIDKVESFLASAGLEGATVQEVIEHVQPGVAVYSMRNALEKSMNVIAMPRSRYVHVTCFVDLDDAEEALGQILSSHFAQFGGYSNSQLLFGAAAQEMSLFLNDNDCENIDAVYAIARFLFGKKAIMGSPCKFCAPHIFRSEPDYPMTLRGLMINLAREHDGILRADDAKEYLQKTMLTYGGLGQLLQISSSNTFLMYDNDCFLLSECLSIDTAWCLHIHDRMDDLFRKANVAYVIPRDISTVWLGTLPPLPRSLRWTRLLLQEVLDKYPDIGFKSISADLNQSLHTLAAAFVPVDSPLQSFPDVVALFMEERHELPMRMLGEDLRLELRDAGMLENCEMIYALPKALNDHRFAWSNGKKTVYVRGNK